MREELAEHRRERRRQSASRKAYGSTPKITAEGAARCQPHRVRLRQLDVRRSGRTSHLGARSTAAPAACAGVAPRRATPVGVAPRKFCPGPAATGGTGPPAAPSRATAPAAAAGLRTPGSGGKLDGPRTLLCRCILSARARATAEGRRGGPPPRKHARATSRFCSCGASRATAACRVLRGRRRRDNVARAWPSPTSPSVATDSPDGGGRRVEAIAGAEIRRDDGLICGAAAGSLAESSLKPAFVGSAARRRRGSAGPSFAALRARRRARARPSTRRALATARSSTETFSDKVRFASHAAEPAVRAGIGDNSAAAPGSGVEAEL